MKSKTKLLLIIITLILIIVGLGYYDIKKSEFTEVDLQSQRELSIEAQEKREDLLIDIENIPFANEVVYLSDNTSTHETECFISKSKKTADKKRYCEKETVAYIGFDKERLESVKSYIRRLITSPSYTENFSRLSLSESTNLELETIGYHKRNIQIKIHSIDNTSFSEIPDLLKRNDFIVDFYSRDQYSNITRSQSFYEFFIE